MSWARKSDGIHCSASRPLSAIRRALTQHFSVALEGAGSSRGRRRNCKGGEGIKGHSLGHSSFLPRLWSIGLGGPPDRRRAWPKAPALAAMPEHHAMSCLIGSLSVMSLATAPVASGRMRSSATLNSVCMIVPMRLRRVTGMSKMESMSRSLYPVPVNGFAFGGYDSIARRLRHRKISADRTGQVFLDFAVSRNGFLPCRRLPAQDNPDYLIAFITGFGAGGRRGLPAFGPIDPGTCHFTTANPPP